MILLVCPAAALAVPDTPYAQETVLSVAVLTETQSALVDSLYGPLMQHEASITLPERTLYDDVVAAMTALLQDYPEMFHVHRNYSISYERSKPEYALTLTPQYRMTAAEAALLRQQMYIRAGQIIAADADPLALHDALCLAALYGGDTEMRHTAPAALLDGLATCEGYAQALSLLYRMAGIPCGVVIGTASSSHGETENHAWNIALLEGYTLIDATWNDQNALGCITHWYYGLSTTQMAQDHTAGENQQVPDCIDASNWHRTQGLYVLDIADAYNALRLLATTGEAANLRILDKDLYEQMSSDIGGLIDVYNASCPVSEAFYGAYSYTLNDAQQCILLTRSE